MALACSDDGAWLYVANRAGGTISVIDTHRRSVSAEAAVGAMPADLEAVPGRGLLLSADEGSGRLDLVRVRGPEVVVVGGIEVPSSPVGVAIDPGGRLAFVASLWPRRLSVVELGEAEGGEPRSVVLPFERGRRSAGGASWPTRSGRPGGRRAGPGPGIDPGAGRAQHPGALDEQGRPAAGRPPDAQPGARTDQNDTGPPSSPAT
ncbi:YncE family protein [Tautonia plasticadhaerens]|uniref:YncE family protein n=1 Tax=Tautonia plasticadhaerens TaxID=2527974 RepID=UPI0018D1FCA5|nr:hypothetical protein [Tautonia plasticadhaerens]